MDSLSQLALGSAVGVAVMGRRTPVWKAALWGGIAGTLPDLDAFIDHGDALRNMTFHRAESHSLVYLTLFAPALALLVAKLHGELGLFRRWWLALWLVLITHPILDWMTIYGTQLWIPFTDTPFGLGSMFIIDPLYTVPLLIGLGGALGLRNALGLRWNSVGLACSCLYLGWAAAAQWRVEQVADRALAAAGIPYEQLLATPTAFNTILWRVVAMTEGGYVEGFYSLADPMPRIRFDRYSSNDALREALAGNWNVERLAWFTRGYYRLEQRDDRAVMTDLRMGQEPDYAFAFLVAEHGSGWRVVPPESVGGRTDIRGGLRWLWRRMWDEQMPPFR